ncbi:MAG: cupin domain-containing protein [Candidatus Tectomicrobia bacterium]|uniref:Cupin domain-containing protein n=1 Tax=Tectimicrobiota bacterium TaxID=2528274 RepID=A0A932HZS9_UNCTE|nr:cupin domain-containing protein [Candidatus Tectomicrobia bacterium]
MRSLASIATLSAVLIFAGFVGTVEGGGHDEALPKGFKTTPVLKSGMTASNGKIEYPKTGAAEIVSVVGVLEPGGRTARHQHPVPVFVYVLEGTLKVKADGHEARTYKTGQSFLEDINLWHQAFNEGTTPAKVLVVFMGETGKPTTVNAK